LVKPTAAFLKSLPKDSPVRELVKERDGAAKSCFASLDAWISRIAKDWKKLCATKPAAQRKFSGELETLAAACRDLVKDVDLVFKLALRVVDSAEKDADAKDDDSWNTREIGKLEKDLDARRAEIVEQLKATAYFERQAHWLISRFPDAKLVDVPGLVKLVDRQEIAAADWSLTPGRYVGVAPAEVDDDFDFEQALGDIHVETNLSRRGATVDAGGCRWVAPGFMRRAAPRFIVHAVIRGLKPTAWSLVLSRVTQWRQTACCRGLVRI
jgi:type I restriction enzyme M protein